MIRIKKPKEYKRKKRSVVDIPEKRIQLETHEPMQEVPELIEEIREIKHMEKPQMELEMIHKIIDAPENGVLPSDNGVLPSDNVVIPSDNGVLPLENEVLPLENEVLPLENEVLPSDNGVILSENENVVIPSDNVVIPSDNEAILSDNVNVVIPSDNAAEIKLEIKPEIKPEELPKNYKEYYLDGYCSRYNMSEQYYAQNESKDEIYWRDSVNAQIYAQKHVDINNVHCTIEYPAIKNGYPDYIYDRGGKPRYPVNLVNNNIIFPRNPITNEEIYLQDKIGNIFYPENKYGQQFYRKDFEGNDVPINNMYAQFSNGTQIYPKKANGDQFYLKIDNKEVPAIKRNEKVVKPYYAVNANGDEIYPREYLETD